MDRNEIYLANDLVYLRDNLIDKIRQIHHNVLNVENGNFNSHAAKLMELYVKLDNYLKEISE